HFLTYRDQVLAQAGHSLVQFVDLFFVELFLLRECRADCLDRSGKGGPDFRKSATGEGVLDCIEALLYGGLRFTIAMAYLAEAVNEVVHDTAVTLQPLRNKSFFLAPAIDIEAPQARPLTAAIAGLGNVVLRNRAAVFDMTGELVAEQGEVPGIAPGVEREREISHSAKDAAEGIKSPIKHFQFGTRHSASPL